MKDVQKITKKNIQFDGSDSGWFGTNKIFMAMFIFIIKKDLNVYNNVCYYIKKEVLYF